MQAVYLNPLTDFGFKKLFGNTDATEILIHFLNAFLPSNCQVAQIIKMQVGFNGYSVFDSNAIIDVQCLNQQGEIFVAELVKALGNYGGHTSTKQFELPIYQSTLLPNSPTHIFVVGVLGFSLKEDESRANTKYYYSTCLNDCADFIVLHPQKFNRPLKELESDAERWLYLLKYLPEMDYIPKSLDEKIFHHVLSVIKLKSP